MMDAFVESRIEELRELCKRYRVARLELFGSATGKGFHTGSDVDFLVSFGPMTPREHCDAFFGLLFELESLFGRSVDLLEVEAIDNPYLLAEAEATKQSLYAA
jgi:uncharacterized protein